MLLRPGRAPFPPSALPAGLKLGIYTDSGSMTCAKYAGSLGFEEEDAAQLAKWKVDYLKHDNCHSIPAKEVGPSALLCARLARAGTR